MERALIIILISLGHLASYATNRIEGIVLDTDSIPVEFANITAFTGDSVAGGGITDMLGHFEFETCSDCNKIRVSYPGYDDAVLSPIRADMGKIILRPASTTLEEVVVRAPVVRREADRIILNVAADPLSANKNARELLKLAPGVWVGDDRLSIYGQGGTSVYIDDRKVNLAGTELSTYLKSIHASSIASIEIIPKGGAEYSADSSGGIIKIILKHNRVDGLNGSAGLNITSGAYKQWINPFANFSLHSGKWTFNFNGSANGCPSERNTGYNDYYNQAISQTMNNTTIYESKALQGNVMAGLFYQPSDIDRLGLQFDCNVSRTQKNNVSKTITMGGDNDDAITQGIYNSNDLFHNFNAAFNWNHDIDINGSELKLIANFNRQSSSVKENNSMKWSYSSNDSIYSTNNRNLYNILTMDFSFKKVFNPKWKLNVGAKYTHNNLSNRSLHSYIKESAWVNNSGYDFDYVHNENIAALYLTSNGAFGRWKMKAGIRGEFYSTRGLMVKRDKFDIFPNANISFDISLDGNYNVALGYYRNIYRPTFRSLNPIEIQNSDYYYSIGNPKLSPSYTNSLNLSFILARNYSLAAGFSETKNSIRQFIRSEPDNPERMYLTWANMGKERQAYIHADGSIDLTQWWNIYASATYCIVSQKITDSDPFETFGFLQLTGNTSFKLPCNFRISVSCFYNTKRRQGNLTIYPLLFITPRIEKHLGPQWSVTLSAEDLLQRLSRYKNTSNGYDVISYSKSHPAINIGVTYKFNTGKGFRSQRIEKNTDNSRFSM